MSTQPSYIPPATIPASGVMPNRRKSWLGRYWIWLLVAVLLCGGLFVLGIFSLIIGAMRGSDVAKEAVARAQSNALVAQRLGAPISEGWFVSGSINVSTGSGDADLTVPISGPKGKGTVYVKALKTAGRWDYSLMQAAIEGSGQRIDLLASAVAAEPPSNTPSPAPQAAAEVPNQTVPSGASAATAAAAQPSDSAPSSSGAASSDIIQSQNTNTPGVVAEIIQFKRSEGVLNVKIRFRNTSGAAINFYVLASGTDYDRFYLTAGTKKFAIAKDSDGSYLAPKADYSCGMPGVCQKLAAGQSEVWWAKFVAPPVSVTKVDLITPVATPFEDVPITDR
jgi:hypothetical protein